MANGSSPEDILKQGSERDPRFTLPDWRPSRAARILAVAALLVGLCAGYAVGREQGGNGAADATASASATASAGVIANATAGSAAYGSTIIIEATGAAPPASQGALPGLASSEPALTEGTGTCSTQVGRDLQVGIPVTNMSTVPVQLLSAKPVDIMPKMLKVLSWFWGPCGYDNAGIVPGVVILGPGETTWLTVTVKPLVACPGPAPLRFTIIYSINGQRASSPLPGFSDLSTVSYTGCASQSQGTGQ